MVLLFLSLKKGYEVFFVVVGFRGEIFKRGVAGNNLVAPPIAYHSGRKYKDRFFNNVNTKRSLHLRPDLYSMRLTKGYRLLIFSEGLRSREISTVTAHPAAILFIYLFILGKKA